MGRLVRPDARKQEPPRKGFDNVIMSSSSNVNITYCGPLGMVVRSLVRVLKATGNAAVRNALTGEAIVTYPSLWHHELRNPLASRPLTAFYHIL